MTSLLEDGRRGTERSRCRSKAALCSCGSFAAPSALRTPARVRTGDPVTAEGLNGGGVPSLRRPAGRRGR